MTKNQRRHVGFLHFVIGSFLMASHSSKSIECTKLHVKPHHKTWQFLTNSSLTTSLLHFHGIPNCAAFLAAWLSCTHTKKITFESRTGDRPFPSCPNASVLKQEYKNKPFTYSVIRTHTVYLWPFFRISVFLTDTRWFWKIKTQKERFYCSGIRLDMTSKVIHCGKNVYTLYS